MRVSLLIFIFNPVYKFRLFQYSDHISFHDHHEAAGVRLADFRVILFRFFCRGSSTYYIFIYRAGFDYGYRISFEKRVALVQQFA